LGLERIYKGSGTENKGTMEFRRNTSGRWSKKELG
jgi:hypothetical protein